MPSFCVETVAWYNELYKFKFSDQFRSVNIPPSVTLTKGGYLYPKSVQKVKGTRKTRICTKQKSLENHLEALSVIVFVMKKHFAIQRFLQTELPPQSQFPGVP